MADVVVRVDDCMFEACKVAGLDPAVELRRIASQALYEALDDKVEDIRVTVSSLKMLINDIEARRI